MSENIAQIFVANPVTTIGNTDLMYIGVTGTTDGAINGTNFKALFLSPTLTSGNIFVGNGSNIATSVALSGDGSLSNTGAITINKIGGMSISLAGSFTTSGAFSVTQTYTGITNVTFPTSGTLATTSQSILPVDQTSGSVTMSVNTRYITDNGSSIVSYTLPTVSSIGAVIEIVGFSSGGWKVNQASGQQCFLGSSGTTVGVTGVLQSTNQNDCITLVCTIANTTFVCRGVQGNITVI